MRCGIDAEGKPTYDRVPRFRDPSGDMFGEIRSLLRRSSCSDYGYAAEIFFEIGT
jgi:hypothetical protein